MPAPQPPAGSGPAATLRHRWARLHARGSDAVEYLGLRLLNGLAPALAFRLQAGIVYGEGSTERLDVYRPRAPWRGGGPRPTVVFLHGGRWQFGHRGLYRFIGEALASRGMAAVIPDYRKYPRVRWPEFAHDCAEAVDWTARHAMTWGGEAGRLVVMGHSAGAHLATLLALDRRLAARMPSVPALHAVVGLSGPYDFLPLTDADLQDLFGTAADPRETQPIHHVEGAAAPMLLIHGGADTTVQPRNTRRLAAALRAAGTTVEELHYPGLDHVQPVLALAWLFRRRYRVLQDIEDFLRRLEARP